MAPIPAPAPEPNPQYARWTREFALILIRDGHTPDDVSFADDAGRIGGVFAELAAEGVGPREAGLMLRRLRAGLRVIDGGGEAVTGPRPSLRVV